MIFLCHGISSDPNRTQFNRIRFVSQIFPLYVVSCEPVSKQAARNSKKIYSFPLSGRMWRFFFFFWAVWTVLRLKKAHPQIKRIYSTYEPRNIILGFLISGWFSLEWIADLWDDPEKMVMASRAFAGPVHLLAKKVEFCFARRLLKHAVKIIIGLVPQKIISKFGLREKQCIAITNGINPGIKFKTIAQERPEKEKPNEVNIFYCGPIDEVRLEGLPECFKILLQSVKCIRFIAAGPELGNGVSWLTGKMADLGNSVSLEVPGYQPYLKILDLIGASDVCICPYPDKLDLATAYPVKIFDYMAMGKPLVASSLSGIKAIVTHKEDALLFSPGDYHDMADCILRLISSETLRRNLGANAQKNVMRFSWDIIHRRLSVFLKS